jgi:hypothetical protein
MNKYIGIVVSLSLLYIDLKFFITQKCKSMTSTHTEKQIKKLNCSVPLLNQYSNNYIART